MFNISIHPFSLAEEYQNEYNSMPIYILVLNYIHFGIPGPRRKELKYILMCFIFIDIGIGIGIGVHMYVFILLLVYIDIDTGANM